MARNSRGGAIGILLLLGVLLGMTQGETKIRVWNQLKQEWEEFNQVENKIRVWNQLTQEWQEFKKIEPLTPEDKQYDPNFDPPGRPKAPVTCPQDNRCRECFAKPYADLQSVLRRLEKLRRVYQSTKRMIAENIAFGDAMAPLGGGLTGLEWTQQKMQILASEKNFEATSKAKCNELLDALTDTVIRIAACEDTVYVSSKGWLVDYGQHYLAYMEDHSCQR